MLGRSPIKWRQRSDMSIAVDWDVKDHFKQTSKIAINMNNIIEPCHVTDITATSVGIAARWAQDM